MSEETVDPHAGMLERFRELYEAEALDDERLVDIANRYFNHDGRLSPPQLEWINDAVQRAGHGGFQFQS